MNKIQNTALYPKARLERLFNETCAQVDRVQGLIDSGDRNRSGELRELRAEASIWGGELDRREREGITA